MDNSSAASGASEIYLVKLNGGTAGGPTGATSSDLAAVQAAQANP